MSLSQTTEKIQLVSEKHIIYQTYKSAAKAQHFIPDVVYYFKLLKQRRKKAINA